MLVCLLYFRMHEMATVRHDMVRDGRSLTGGSERYRDTPVRLPVLPMYPSIQLSKVNLTLNHYTNLFHTLLTMSYVDQLFGLKGKTCLYVPLNAHLLEYN